MRIIKAVTVINNDKETGKHISSIITNIIVIIWVTLSLGWVGS